LLSSRYFGDASIDESVNIAVGGSLSEPKILNYILNGGLAFMSEIRVQLSQLWLFEKVRNRKEIADDVPGGLFRGA
jgi:hypothetical protein